MKITKDQAAANRRQIIKTAIESFQSKGIDAVGVNELMKTCGFTHGGFYNHFSSKDELVEESMRDAFEPALKLAEEMTETKDGFFQTIGAYLSEAHRDSPTTGCPSAAFLCDAARQNKSARKVYANGIGRYIKTFEKQMVGSPSERRKEAITTFASMVGAMLLSRAIGDANPALSDEILESAQKSIIKHLKNKPKKV